MSTLVTSNLKNASATNPNIVLNTDGTIGGDCLTQTCRAWVNFDGTGTVAIRASYNVSSITDNGTGYYTVNLTNSVADANYALVTMASSTASFNTMESGSDTGSAINTTSSFFIFTANNSGTFTDARTVCAALFR